MSEFSRQHSNLRIRKLLCCNFNKGSIIPIHDLEHVQPIQSFTQITNQSQTVLILAFFLQFQVFQSRVDVWNFKENVVDVHVLQLSTQDSYAVEMDAVSDVLVLKNIRTNSQGSNKFTRKSTCWVDNFQIVVLKKSLKEISNFMPNKCIIIMSRENIFALCRMSFEKTSQLFDFFVGFKVLVLYGAGTNQALEPFCQLRISFELLLYDGKVCIQQ